MDNNLNKFAMRIMEELMNKNGSGLNASTASVGDGEKYVCPSCGRVALKSDSFELPDGTTVCNDCKEKYYRQCEHCGEWFDKRIEGKMVGQNWYCARHRSLYRECVCCGKVVEITECKQLSNGDWVCESCASENYNTCYDCGALFDANGGRTCEDGGWRCDCCADEYDSNHSDDDCREGIMEYHDFNQSLYRPHRIDESDPEEKLLMGVELECDDGDFDASDFSWWTDDMKYLVHFEKDGSLSDDHGVECITMPCSLRYHLEKMDWTSLCRKFINSGFKSHNTDCCGLHVHLSRSALSPMQIVKMDVFFNRGVEFWSLIGRRREIYSGEYDEKKMAKVDKGFQRHGTHDDRYQVVNTTNPDTVELRFCRGTLNVETILGTLEMFHAVPKYLDTIPICHIYDTDKNIVGFIRYLVDNRDKYKHVLPIMRRLVRKGKYSSIVGEYYGKYIAAKNDGEND